MAKFKRTVLYDWHKSHGAKIVPFGGYEMPLYYSSIVGEHRSVRESVGMFDVSHMGQIRISNDKALDFIDYLLSAKFRGNPEGKVKYSFLLNENGGIVDDLLVYIFSPEDVLLVVNAANVEKDINYINVFLPKDLSLSLLDYGNIAVQGPDSYNVLKKFIDFSLDSLKFYYFRSGLKFRGKDIVLSHTGYTGDLGFEIYAKNEDILYIWETLIDSGVVPCGLGARDTLRIEAGYPLYGHELSEDVNPIEAGLSNFIYWDKDFIGKKALLEIKKDGIEKKLIGFTMQRGVPRQGYKIFKDNEEIGYVTSGTSSPILGKMIGMGYVYRLDLLENDVIFIDIRGKKQEAEIVSFPFYNPKGR